MGFKTNLKWYHLNNLGHVLLWITFPKLISLLRTRTWKGWPCDKNLILLKKNSPFEALLINTYNSIILDDGFTFFEILEGKYGLPLTTYEFFCLTWTFLVSFLSFKLFVTMNGILNFKSYMHCLCFIFDTSFLVATIMEHWNWSLIYI